MRKVVHLTSTHFPFDARVFQKECRTLAGADYESHLVVPHETTEVVDGVHVHGVEPPRNRRERILKTTARVVRRGWMLDADLYHVHDPELLPYAALLSTVAGHTVVYDAHEDLAASIHGRSWITKELRAPMSWVAEKLESFFADRMDGIVTATSAIEERFRSALPPVVPVQNFPILEDMDRAVPSSATTYCERPARVAYIGGLTRARGTVEMIEALGAVEDSLNPSMTIAGHFQSDVLRNEVERKEGWKRVDFRGRVPQQEAFCLLKEARLGVVVMQPVPNYVEAQPLKLFEYMAAEIPVVASNFPLWRSILGERECGLLVDPRRPDEIAGAIEWVLRHPKEAEAMGRRGRRRVEQTYNWNEEAQRLLALYRLLLSGRSETQAESP